MKRSGRWQQQHILYCPEYLKCWVGEGSFVVLLGLDSAVIIMIYDIALFAGLC